MSATPTSARTAPARLPRSGCHPDLAQDDAEADRQLGTPVGGIQPRLTQEREQASAMSPQVLGQAVVGSVLLWPEREVAPVVLPAAVGFWPTVTGYLPPLEMLAVTQARALYSC